MGIQHFLLLLVGLYSVNCIELVPVYMWQTTPSKGLFPATAHINEATFTEILRQRQALDTQRIVLFAEQTLSPEDFSNNHETFQELAQLTQDKSKVYLPTVEEPIDGINNLVKEIQRLSVNDVKEGNLPEGNLIIDLNDAKDDEDRIDMLKRHSKIIVKIYEELSKNNQILAVYTGYHSSWIVPSEIRHQRVTRATGDPPQEDAMVLKTEHYLFYIAGNFELTKVGDKEPTIYKPTGVLESSDTEVSIQTDKGDIKISSKVSSNPSYWLVTSVTAGGIVFPTKIYAPAGFSYSCSSKQVLTQKEKITDLTSNYLKFPTIQVQYFEGGVKKERFGDSYDCMGFTSAPIWSGILVTFIFAIIMTFGLTMIMDIRTMDRFDDPKGKTIIINAGE